VGEREYPQADSPLSTEPDVVLDPRTQDHDLRQNQEPAAELMSHPGAPEEYVNNIKASGPFI